MSDFDPNLDPNTQGEADAYAEWCAENFMRAVQSDTRTYRSAVRCAAWLFVVSTGGMHLDEEIERDRDALLEQLAMYQQLGRAIERQRQHYTIERLIVLRSSLDCWAAIGEWGEALLSAAKCAVAAMILTELHPLIDFWDLACPDAWAMLDAGMEHLSAINLADDITFQDFAIAPDETVTAKFTWQRANNLVRHVGAQPLNPN